MNGLRYHYQHSGEHGALGLRMLASGRHDATREQSVERSDEEDAYALAEVREGTEEGEGEGEGAALERAGSAERGRRRERKGGASGRAGQTSSAPSTPGPSQLPSTSKNNGNASLFTTQQQQQQGFTGFAQQNQQSFAFQPQHLLSREEARQCAFAHAMNLVWHCREAGD